MARVNKSSVRKKTAQQAGPKISRHLYKKTNRAISAATRTLLNEFDNHPVTQEIEAGPHSANISMTLGGYGNLFSFLGFNEGSNPITPLRNLLANSIKLVRIRAARNTPSFVIKIKIPTEQEIAATTPLHWASGSSWVDAVENGFSGLGQYLHSMQRKMGRSGTAIEAQVDLGLRPERSSAIDYLSGIVKQLFYNIENNLKSGGVGSFVHSS